jgi:adenylyltransferase/sulfurtransferase
MERYVRQTQLAEIGREGQARLMASSVLVLGCGALGSNLVNTLTRVGVGRVRIVDRDILEENNLPRQMLYDEDDVAARLPKAEAAARKLRRINSAVEIEPLVCDAVACNIETLLEGMSLAVDATDNLETRYLLNDACVKLGKPWIYGGVVGTTGMTMTIVPGEGPCLRCIFPTPPPPGSLPTVETEGVLGTLPTTIAAVEATEAIKLLCGGARSPYLLSIDLWSQAIQQVEVLRDEECPACGRRSFEFLADNTDESEWVTTVCGQQTIQIAPVVSRHLDLEQIERRLRTLGQVTYNQMLLVFRPTDDDRLELVLFPDGRMQIKGTVDEADARRLYSQYVAA